MKKKIMTILVCAAVMLSTACSNNENPSAPSESSLSEVETNGGFAHGKQDGNTYTSEFLGLKAEFGDGWTMQTDEALAQTNFISDMSDENAKKALDKNVVLYEMVAATETSSNVNIVIENLNKTNGGKPLTPEEYIDLAIGNLESQFKAALVDVEVETEKSTTDFLGSEAACINIKVTTGEQVLFQKMIPISRESYMGIVTFSGASEDEINSTMSMFKSI